MTEIDNQEVIELIEGKPSGILSILNEECVVPKGTDGSFADKLFAQCVTTKRLTPLTLSSLGPPPSSPRPPPSPSPSHPAAANDATCQVRHQQAPQAAAQEAGRLPDRPLRGPGDVHHRGHPREEQGSGIGGPHRHPQGVCPTLPLSYLAALLSCRSPVLPLSYLAALISCHSHALPLSCLAALDDHPTSSSSHALLPCSCGCSPRCGPVRHPQLRRAGCAPALHRVPRRGPAHARPQEGCQVPGRRGQVPAAARGAPRHRRVVRDPLRAVHQAQPDQEGGGVGRGDGVQTAALLGHHGGCPCDRGWLPRSRAPLGNPRPLRRTHQREGPPRRRQGGRKGSRVARALSAQPGVQGVRRGQHEDVFEGGRPRQAPRDA